MSCQKAHRPCRALALCLAALGVFALCGCASLRIAADSLTRDCPKETVTVDLRIDLSGSTRPLRRPGGEYERLAMSVIREAADSCARLTVTPITGNSAAALPVIDVVFASAVRGNPAAAKADRQRQASGQLSALRTLLGSKQISGSDQLGALALAGQQAAQEPPGSYYAVVVISDMAIKVRGARGYSIYDRPLTESAQRRAFTRELAHLGELPDLSATDGLWFGGVGLGISSRPVARAAASVTTEVTRAAGGKLMFTGPSLRFSLAGQVGR